MAKPLIQPVIFTDLHGTLMDRKIMAGPFWDSIFLRLMGGRSKAEEVHVNNHSYDAHALADALMVTGPSGTNVNDLRVLLIEP